MLTVSMLMESLSPASHSSQCPTQSCYSGNSEAKQQLQHQRRLGASTQRNAERHHPGVQGKHTSAKSSHMFGLWAVSLCFIWRQQALNNCTNSTKLLHRKHCHIWHARSFFSHRTRITISLIKFILIIIGGLWTVQKRRQFNLMKMTVFIHCTRRDKSLTTEKRNPKAVFKTSNVEYSTLISCQVQWLLYLNTENIWLCFDVVLNRSNIAAHT